MHKCYIDLLVCPICHGKLEWHINEENEERIINAKAVCRSCNEKYEVRDEIAACLTSALSRNDLWEQSKGGLEKYLDENHDVYVKLMNTPEEELSGADYWFKAAYYEMKKDFKNSSMMFEHAAEKIYTKDYINGWESQMNYIINNVPNRNVPVVDIASGRGYLVEKLLSQTGNYIIATDFSPTVLIRNKEYYKFKGLYDRLSLIAFDARMTPFKDNSIEFITSNLGIQNIEQPGKVIDEMYRICKSKFLSVMQFINKDDKVHMDLISKFGSTAYATRDNAFETFKNSGWMVDIANSYIARIKPTPKGSILSGGEIDGFPIEDTNVEYGVIAASKKQI